MRRNIYIIIIGVVACLSACTSNSKADDSTTQDRSNVFYEQPEQVDAPGFVTAQDGVAPTEPTPGMKRCYQAEMSREEDAYEEGRALGEEDRLNGTRSHEGDYDDDEDYDEDYDEGYGEEE